MLLMQQPSRKTDRLIRRLARKQEPLNGDLIPYLNVNIGMVRHPILYTHIPADRRFGLVNHIYTEKKAAVEKARADRDFGQFIGLHQLPWQVWAFNKIAKKLDDKEYWELLGEVWTIKEFFSQFQKLWLKLLTANRPNKHRFMIPSERKYLRSLPNEFTVYRGFDGPNGKSLSWTLCRDKAIWFANRFKMLDKKPSLATGTVRKENVIAYISRRKEKEIIVDPNNVMNFSTTRI